MRKIEHEYSKHVLEKLDELKAKSKNKISIAFIRGRNCVYEYKYIVDKDTRLRKKKTFYIGYIDNRGAFVAALHRKESTKSEGIDEYLGKMERRTLGGEYNLVYPEKLDLDILRELSMNSRASAFELADRLGVTKSTILYRVKKLEKEYGIIKTIEVYPERFGFTRYVVTVKFFGEKPPFEELKKLFDKELRVQLVLLMKGSYDLFIYILAENTIILEEMIFKLRSEKLFSGHQSAWNIGYIMEAYGFIPLRNEFFTLLEERIWQRTRESPRRTKDQLFKSEFVVLKELNKDAGRSFSSMDNENKLNNGSSQYTYHKLLEKKFIERATITMTKVPMKYCAFFYLKQIDIIAFNTTRMQFLREIIEETDNPTDKHIFEGDVSAPHGSVFITPIFDSSIEAVERKLKTTIKGIEVESAIVTDVITGSLGFRRFDNKRSSQLEVIKDPNAKLETYQR